MARTTSTAVQGVLGRDYDGSTDLTPYIDIASALVDQVVVCAAAKSIAYGFTDAVLEVIERWMAANYYTIMDPTYKARATASASGTFNKNPDAYKDAAIDLDPTGCLNALLKRQRAGAVWLGKYPSDQIPYSQKE